MDSPEDDSVFEEKPSPVNFRLSRKFGEKLRRDRLNNLITQLAEEIPLVKYAHRRLDKSAILRLTVSYLKLNNGLKRKKLGGKAGVQESRLLSWFNRVTDEALLILTCSGTVLYVSPKITQMIGFYQTDMVGHNIKRFVHPDDLDLLMSQFYVNTSAVSSAYASFPHSSGDCRPDKLQILQTKNNAFYLRLMKAVRGRHSADVPREYESMLVHAHCERFPEDQERKSTSVSELWMVASLKPVAKEPIREVEVKAAEFLNNNEWASMHDLDSKILAIDQRASLFSGFLASEVKGRTPYMLINVKDLESVALSHKIILQDQEIPMTVFRMNNKMDTVMYVQSRSVIINDQWTKKPKCIVSVNTVLVNNEGRYLLDLQKKRVEEWKKNSGKSVLETDTLVTVKLEPLSDDESGCDDEMCNKMGASDGSGKKQKERTLNMSLSEVYDREARKYPELYMKVEGLCISPPVSKRSYDSMDSESGSTISSPSGGSDTPSGGNISDMSSTGVSDADDASPKQRSPTLKELLSCDKTFKKASLTKSKSAVTDPKSLPLLKGILEGRVKMPCDSYSPAENYISRDMIFKHSGSVVRKETKVAVETEDGASSSPVQSPKTTQFEEPPCGGHMDPDQGHAAAHGIQSPTVGSSEAVLGSTGPGDLEANGAVTTAGIQNHFTAQLETKHSMLQQTISNQTLALKSLRAQIQSSHNNMILDSTQKNIQDTLISRLLEAESQVQIQNKLLEDLQEEIRAQKQTVTDM